MFIKSLIMWKHLPSRYPRYNYSDHMAFCRFTSRFPNFCLYPKYHAVQGENKSYSAKNDMILQPCNVELTKIHYYDSKKCQRHFQIPSISREVSQNEFNKNVLIKKNIFGHKWVLKINEECGGEKKKKSKLKFVLYILVFCSIVVAVAFGIFFSIDNFFKENTINSVIVDRTNETSKPSDAAILINVTKYRQDTHENLVTELPEFSQNDLETKNLPASSIKNVYCQECQEQNSEVCMKLSETGTPQCVEKLDKKDPTGCGGLCKINTEFCQLLDKHSRVYQCFNLKHLLKCPDDTYNCGNMCIPVEKRCDGIVHCMNKSDENGCDCNLKTHFQCGDNTSCLDKSKKCNGVVDCWDKSDELDCGNTTPCAEDYFPCLNGECVHKDKFCNKMFDCKDLSDEPIWCQ